MPDLNQLEPLHIEGVMDYHVHCDYSVDAVGTIEEYCEAALQRNLAEICFTTHYDNDPKSDDPVSFIHVNGEDKITSIENLAPYVDHVRKAAELYYVKGLSVKLGLEFGWYKNCEEEVIRLKEKYDFDYFLCGIHEIDNICYCSRNTYEKCYERFSAEEMVKRYYQQVKLAAESKMFDTIAHLNYYIKYAHEYYGDSILKAYEPYLEDIFSVLIKNNVNLEINTAGIRHGLDQYYPDMTVINKAKKAGVSVKYLGSDAHRPEDIGFEFEVAAALVPDTITGSEE